MKKLRLWHPPWTDNRHGGPYCKNLGGWVDWYDLKEFWIGRTNDNFWVFSGLYPQNTMPLTPKDQAPLTQQIICEKSGAGMVTYCIS